MAFKGAWSGVSGGVLSSLGRGERCERGESGGVFARDLHRGLSISAEAIRAWLHGTLDWEEGLATGSGGSSAVVEAGVSHLSLIVGLVLTSGCASVESTSAGEPEFSVCALLSSTMAASAVGELQGLLVGARTSFLSASGLHTVSVSTTPSLVGSVLPGGPRLGGMSCSGYVPGVSV